MSAYFDGGDVALHLGDALDVARTLPDESVQTIVTSPPYFGLRDYGQEGQYGAEASLADYVEHMVQLFRELRRVLADEGTLWLNLGDSFAVRWGSKRPTGRAGFARDDEQRARTGSIKAPLAEKNLLGVPWRVAFALQDDGWILRSDIVWHKPNPMPEPVTDRPTRSHEYLFMFAKSKRYHFDGAAIAETAVGSKNSGRNRDLPHMINHGNAKSPQWDGGESRNARDVWTIPTVPFGEAHFAVYPPDLVRPCILAGSKPGDTVLDPFSGSGTTGAVATFEGRKYIGIDLNREYLDLSLRTRFQQPALPWGESA